MHAQLHKGIIKCDKRALFAQILPFCTIHLCKVKYYTSTIYVTFILNRVVKKWQQYCKTLSDWPELIFKIAPSTLPLHPPIYMWAKTSAIFTHLPWEWKQWQKVVFDRCYKKCALGTATHLAKYEQSHFFHKSLKLVKIPNTRNEEKKDNIFKLMSIL